MKNLILALSLLPTPALALDCIPEPDKLTYGDKVSDAWVQACEHKYRNPLPTCHHLYAKPDDRALCLGVITKLDAYDKQKPAVMPSPIQTQPKK
jgi:hypothetical protein